MGSWERSRRFWLRGFGVTLLAVAQGGRLVGPRSAIAQAASAADPLEPVRSPLLRPRSLQPGDTIAVVAPAGMVAAADLVDGCNWLQRQGFRVQVGRHVFNRDGYLAGRDRDRAADLNRAFADPAVAAIICARGGWGCARLLPLLDWDLARLHPKILLGFSDITALLLAYSVRSNLVTFHGPVIASSWNAFSTAAWRQVLVDGQPMRLANPPTMPHRPIYPGQARGPLVVANLSVLAAMVGSPYLPRWDGVILIVEEVSEPVYRIDRLLSQLKLAGILDRLAGFVFAQCTRCAVPGDRDPTLSLSRVLQDWIRPLEIPSWQGFAVGHIPEKLTLPLGVEVAIDASRGTVELLEPAVLTDRPSS
ncbi:MAG TPA: LD-carboxypeptidase, partial [Coleofasciculaceae cyanobacterium]